MTSQVTEETNANPAPTAGEKPKANKKARVAPQGAHAAKKQGKSGKKASPAKKAPKGPKKPDRAREKKADGGRAGSKTSQILDLLKRPGGVTAKQLMKATGWQPHSVRGFLSGTIGKKMGLTVVSAKSGDGDRTYSISR